jgi:uncharacterized membrane protein
MSVIFEAMGLYKIVVSGIDLSPLASAEELITFQLAQRQGLLVIIQVVSNEILAKLPNLRLHMICGSTSGHLIDMQFNPFYVFVLRSFMRIEQESVWQRYSLSEFISAFETEWNRIAHLSQSSAASSSTYS